MKKVTLTLAALLLAVACRKNPHISQSEISQLTQTKVDRILVQKKYQLDSSASFEDITLFEADQKTRLAVFTPGDKGYTLLRQHAWPQLLTDAKLFFISVGNRKSQVLVIHGQDKKTLVLFDGGSFMQEFKPEQAETSTVKMTKVEEKPNDEVLVLGKDNYRFNGMRWIIWQNDEIFPYVETFEVAGEQSLIEITNRGEFGTRVLLTLAFTDVSAADIAQKLKLTKDIPTVSLYRPGASVHKNGGGNVGLPHPLIEIRKDSWGKNGKIKLPLYMKDVSRYTLRAVYSQRGKSLNWPASGSLGIEKDGQGYWAVRRD